MEPHAAVTYETAANGPPTAPYLQRPGRGTPPDGWVAEPVRGGWHGQRMEVVYDAHAHQVAFLWRPRRDRREETLDVLYEHQDRDVTLISSKDAAGSERALEALGWTQLAVDGPRSFWTRDRHVAARAALSQLDRDAAPTPKPHGVPVDHPEPRGPQISL